MLASFQHASLLYLAKIYNFARLTIFLSTVVFFAKEKNEKLSAHHSLRRFLQKVSFLKV
jgi:hypothetical protein